MLQGYNEGYGDEAIENQALEQGTDNSYGNNEILEENGAVLTNEGYAENGADVNNLDAAEEEFGTESNEAALENSTLDNSV